jgi:phage shock protein PspC (stress-responsive transcriptional regulator)
MDADLIDLAYGVWFTWGLLGGVCIVFILWWIVDRRSQP